MHGHRRILRDAWNPTRTTPTRADDHVGPAPAWRDAISESGSVFLDHARDEGSGGQVSRRRGENGAAYRDDCRPAAQYGTLDHEDSAAIVLYPIDGTADIVEDGCSTSRTDARDHASVSEPEGEPTDTTDMTTNTTDMKTDWNRVAEESADAF